jgi:phage terminase large subunit GpA-like protein
MLAVTEPGVHIITVMVATQLLKTSLLENTSGYFAHLDPCPMLLVQPKDEAAEQFSKERITPMIKATPVLRALIGTGKTRSAEETLLYKSFPGGFLALAGAGSPDNLARRPVRVVMYDEADKYPVTREGDPFALGDERMASFVNWLSLRACSPTIQDASRIAASYAQSDQRRASLECPKCHHRQFLDFFKHVNWEKDGETHKPKTARISCEACGEAWSEGERLYALQTARWHQTAPYQCCGVYRNPLDDYDKNWREHGDEGSVDRIWDWWAGDRYAVYLLKCPKCSAAPVSNEHAGFQCSKLYSPWPKDSPASIAAKWLDAQGDEEKKQAWWNTQAGLPYRPDYVRSVQVEALASRREVWEGEIPDGVALLTAGIDTQDFRLEVELVGWGRDEESWSLSHTVIEGSPELPETWAALDGLLRRQMKRADGRTFVVEAACIDSGGHHTQRVYEFAKARLGRRIWAIKGESAKNGQRNPVWPAKRPTSKTKQAFRPIIIGVNAAKDVIRSNLLKEQAAPGEPTPGYMHFPADRELNYFEQFNSERIVVKVIGGRKYRVWEQIPGRANEALDCRVYAYAALCGLKHFGLKLNERVDAVVKTVGAPQVSHAPRPPARRTIPSGFMR